MKHIVITGGNKGIGLELCRMFVLAGHQVTVIARDFSTFEFSQHPSVECIEYDLSDVNGLESLCEGIKQVDVLVNNAGILQALTYESYSDELREYSLNLNLVTPVTLIKLLADKLKKVNGRVINNASIAGQIGHPDIWYGAAKAGLINATKSFSKSFEGQVIVNAVAPSPTQTDMLNNIPEHRQQSFLKNTISGRFATAQEIAQTIYWLATDSPEYINGSCLDINNGSFSR